MGHGVKWIIHPHKKAASAQTEAAHPAGPGTDYSRLRHSLQSGDWRFMPDDRKGVKTASLEGKTSTNGKENQHHG